jgi:hypothetical protein
VPDRPIDTMFRVSVSSWPIPRRVLAWSFSSAFLWLTYLCYLSPLFVTLADVARIQLSPVLLSLLGAAILGVVRGESWREPVAR